jgi:hypothetical protein
MSLSSLPEELIIHILSYISREYIMDEYTIEDIEEDIENAIKDGMILSIEDFENKKKLAEYGDGMYYAGAMLYATSKHYSFLDKYEYLCSENGEFHNDLVSRDINGRSNGITLNACHTDNIGGYGYYENNKQIYENIIYTDHHYYYYRDINGITYNEDRECFRWNNDCDSSKCKSCEQIDAISNEIFTRDPLLKTLLNEENGNVVLRQKRDMFKNANFVFEHNLKRNEK